MVKLGGQAIQEGVPGGRKVQAVGLCEMAMSQCKDGVAHILYEFPPYFSFLCSIWKSVGEDQCANHAQKSVVGSMPIFGLSCESQQAH